MLLQWPDLKLFCILPMQWYDLKDPMIWNHEHFTQSEKLLSKLLCIGLGLISKPALDMISKIISEMKSWKNYPEWIIAYVACELNHEIFSPKPASMPTNLECHNEKCSPMAASMLFLRPVSMKAISWAWFAQPGSKLSAALDSLSTDERSPIRISGE